MVFTEQQLQVKKLVDVQQDIEIDALNDGVGALSTSMQNGFTEAANNFNDIENSFAAVNTTSNDRYNTLYGAINSLSDAMDNSLLALGNSISNVATNTSDTFNSVNSNIANSIDNYNVNIQNQFNVVNYTFEQVNNDVATAIYNIWDTCNNMNASIANSVTTNLLTANDIYIDTSAAPVNSTAALGYDVNGKIIPITTIVNANVSFPPNADYLYTDGSGTAFAGSFNNFNNNFANIDNQFNDFGNAVQNAFNDYNDSLNGICNNIDNIFNNYNNQFNDYNNQFNDVNSQFNNINNTFLEMNNELNGQFNDYNNQFNDVYNSFNLVDDTFAGVQNQFNDVNNTFNSVNSSISNVSSYNTLSTTNNNTSTGYLVPGAGIYADGDHVLTGNGEWVSAVAVSSSNITKAKVTVGAITRNTNNGRLSGTLTFKKWDNSNLNVKVFYDGVARGAENYTFSLVSAQITAETTNITKVYYFPFYPINQNYIMPGLVSLLVSCTVGGTPENPTYSYTGEAVVM